MTDLDFTGLLLAQNVNSDSNALKQTATTRTKPDKPEPFTVKY